MILGIIFFSQPQKQNVLIYGRFRSPEAENSAYLLRLYFPVNILFYVLTVIFLRITRPNISQLFRPLKQDMYNK